MELDLNKKIEHCTMEDLLQLIREALTEYLEQLQQSPLQAAQTATQSKRKQNPAKHQLFYLPLEVKDFQKFTLTKAAEMLGTTDETIRKYIKLGIIPPGTAKGNKYILTGADLKRGYNNYWKNKF